MRYFSPESRYTPPFDPRHYMVEDPDVLFVCLVHAADTSDEAASYGFIALLDHLGETERERRLNLMEIFGSDSSNLLKLLEEIANATGAVDDGIHDAIEASDDETLTAEQRELVLSVDGAGPDDILEAAARARTVLANHPAALACLLDLEDHQLAADSARAQLVELLLKHEPAWHKENREQDAAFHERFKDHPNY